jgi:hypothetical protein
MYFISYVIQLYLYVSISQNFIQHNVMKENYGSQIISLNNVHEQDFSDLVN